MLLTGMRSNGFGNHVLKQVDSTNDWHGPVSTVHGVLKKATNLTIIFKHPMKSSTDVSREVLDELRFLAFRDKHKAKLNIR